MLPYEVILCGKVYMEQSIAQMFYFSSQGL